MTTRPVGVEPGDGDLAARRVDRDDLVVDPVLEAVLESLGAAKHAGQPERRGELGPAAMARCACAGRQGDSPSRPAAGDERIGAVVARRRARGRAARPRRRGGRRGGRMRVVRIVVALNCSSGRRSTVRPGPTSGRCPTSRRRSRRGEVAEHRDVEGGADGLVRPPAHSRTAARRSTRPCPTGRRCSRRRTPGPAASAAGRLRLRDREGVRQRVVFASAAWQVETKTRLLWRPARFALISFEKTTAWTQSPESSRYPV